MVVSARSGDPAYGLFCRVLFINPGYMGVRAGSGDPAYGLRRLIINPGPYGCGAGSGDQAYGIVLPCFIVLYCSRPRMTVFDRDDAAGTFLIRDILSVTAPLLHVSIDAGLKTDSLSSLF